MRPLLAFLLLLLCVPLHAATAIDVGSTVVVPQVKRFGISGISHYYYDRVLLKNLVHRNAGFEGLLFQSVMRCNSDMTATGCIDSNAFTQWPTGFWNGATYEFILGNAKGRTGTIASYTAPPPQQTAIASTWVFGDSGTVPAQGDYFVARRYAPGGADIGWNLTPFNGATFSTETADLPPGTDGRQCLRISASGAGQAMQLFTPFGWHAGQTFVVLNGNYRVSFKAKGLGGTNITVVLARNGSPLKTETVPLSATWQNHNLDFSVAESGIPSGFLTLSFNVNGASLLIDDVSLVQTNSDVTNTTAFRDPVVAAIRSFNPGSLKIHVLDLGDSIDDLIATPFGRRRTGYQASATNNGTSQYGWHEFLELCEHVGAEPYLILPIATSETEVRNALEYLGGPSTSPYGARRAARGRAAPWTDAFSRIHIEYGNEAWNPVFLGGTLFAADYGRRGNDLYAVARQSPYYSSKYNLILGVQAANPFNSRITHNASANHDMLSIGPYIGTNVDDYATNEQLFGGLFTEASFWSMASNGPVKQTYDFINATSRPVPLMVYEVNLHTTGGSISQQALDSFTPSLGAGLGVGNHMMNMLREQKIRDQLVFSLGGYRYDRTDGKTVLLWAITRDMGVTDRKRPQFLVVKLLNEVLSGDLVQITQSGDNPTWDQPLTNGRFQMNNIPFIQSYGLVNGSRKGVVIFNLHRTASLDVTVGGANAPRGTVTMKRLTSAAITDSNESAENVVITTTQLSNFGAAQTLTLPPFSMTVLTSDTPSRLRGDVSGNGAVTAFDASLVLQAVVGSMTLAAEQQCAADYNANGTASAFDASLILQCVVGGACSTSTCN